jgi:D-amino-acid oxidase
MMDTHIVVIGAGVIGLTTALVLKQKGYTHVTIIAKYVQGDMCIEYTSPFAGMIILNYFSI